MKSRGGIVGLAAIGLTGLTGYWLASSRPLDQELVYIALIFGLLICDRAFRLRDPRK